MKIEVKYNYEHTEGSTEYADEKKIKDEYVARFVNNVVALGDMVKNENGVINIEFINEGGLLYYADITPVGFSSPSEQLIDFIAM